MPDGRQIIADPGQEIGLAAMQKSRRAKYVGSRCKLVVRENGSAGPGWNGACGDERQWLAETVLEISADEP